MNDFDPIENQKEGRGDRSLDPTPIIIVQRSRPTWVREGLLLILLLAMAGYHLDREYKGTPELVRGAYQQTGQVIDAVRVAPLSQGQIVLRSTEPSPELDKKADESREEARQFIPEPLPSDSSHSVFISDDPASYPVDSGDLETGIHSGRQEGSRTEAETLAERDASPLPQPVENETIASESPRRSSSVIVWDRDRQSMLPEDSRESGIISPPSKSEDRRVIDQATTRVDDRQMKVQTPAERRYFQQCLALAIRKYGRQAGPHIDGLCREFQMPLPSQVVLLERRYGSNLFVKGADLEQTVTALRRIGAPEAYLVEQLSEQFSRTIGARHGPRDRMEARVFAARKLLAIPVVTPRVVSGSSH